VFGAELPIYRGHVHRVIGLVEMQCDAPPGTLGPAAFFHDAGLWFDGGTWDYLPPSIALATAEVDAEDADLVAAMIDDHHKVRPTTHPNPIVEAFRRADLADVTAGLIPAPGVGRAGYRALVERYPARGFRPMLLRAFGRGLREAPLRPLPMFKL
jgi:hypothetical protein